MAAPAERAPVPWRNDLIYRLLLPVARRNPFQTGFVYFAVTYVGLYLVGWATGRLHGGDGLPAMYANVADNINLAFLAPVGAGLLCALYNAIEATFLAVGSPEILPPAQAEAYAGFAARADRLYNSAVAAGLALLVSLLLNGWFYLTLDGSWLGWRGGLTGLYGRLIIVVNYFMLLLATYKCLVTVYALSRMVAFDIRVRPLHPDRSGGLRPVGALALAVHYFLALVIVFFTILYFFDTFSLRAQPALIAALILLYLFAIFSLFYPLGRLHRLMVDRKRLVLGRLGRTFDLYYGKLSAGADDTAYDLDSADEIKLVSDLYEIADRMPEWPFDAKSLARFYSAITVPLILFLVNLFMNADSILYNFDKLNKIVK